MPKDKKFLSDFFLDDKLFNEFDLKVEEAIPVRSAFILLTDKGTKILKKVKYPIEDLMFIYDSLNEIRKNYPYVLNFRLTKDEKPYLSYEGDVYVVLDYLDGREIVFQNPIDLKKSVVALSKFHDASKNIKLYEKRNLLGSMIIKFNERIKNLEKFKEIANMHFYKTRFDEIFLEYVDYYIEQIREAANYLENSEYKNMNEYVLCHHDLAHHNLIIGNDENIYFVDFDYCILDIRVHDLANIINKVIKDNNFSIESLNLILDNYNENSKLSKEEIKVLYGFLLFPKDFYEISRDYYFRTKLWDEDEYVDKLIRKAGYKEERESFLKCFKKIWL